jgi:cation transport regulator
MPFKDNKDLPDSVKKSLPKHGEDIYREAFNHAWSEYKDAKDRQHGRSQEETAHAVAWNAVKKKYEKEKKGIWKEKGQKGGD